MRLINDDCLNAMREMPDNSVDVIMTDPPYGILKHRIEQPIDIEAFFKESLRILKPDSFIVYFGQQPTLTDWNSIAFKYFKYKTEIIWYKRQRTSPMGDIGRVYENIMVAVNGLKYFNNVSRPFVDVKQSLAEFTEWETVSRYIGDIQTLINRPDEFAQGIEFISGSKQHFCHARVTNAAVTCQQNTLLPKPLFSKLKTLACGFSPQNLISFTPHNKLNRDLSGEGKGDHNVKHPTVKPIQLMEYLIDLTSKQGDVIFDPFMGSGTTGLACQNMGRDFIGIELDKEYFGIAQQRIEAAAKVEQNQIVAQPIKPAAKVEENQLRLSL